MTVRLDIDETIEKIYEKPNLTLKKTENGTTQEKDIPEISQLFSTSDDTMAKTIIVEGEPGTGKTSLCKKIVDDWRKVNEKVEQEPSTSYLRKFEFIFYIILRLVKTDIEVKAIIVEHILKKIDSGYENAHSLLGEILKSEHCLLLLDGLDEWRGKMPHIETSWINCTALITTRPYKLAELRVIPTQMGKHVQLNGVQNPEELVLKVIRKLEEYHKTNKPPKACIIDLKGKHLWHFSANPVVLVHIVWLWQKSKLRENMSRSSLYQEIINERWYEMCDKKEQDKDPHELYDVLSEIAFDKMLSENEDESLVFNIKGKQLEIFKQFKEASLESGILSGSNVPGERFPQYQFLHKTFQEFLAAVFLSNRGSTVSTSCKLVKEIYSNHRNEGAFALKEVFLFLCGLNPVAAAEFSKTLNELFTENCEKQGLKTQKVRTFQNMILSGYDEAERSGHIGAEFCLQHIVLDSTNLTAHHMSKLKLCLENERKSNLKSMRIAENIASTLQHMDDPSVLDLNICTNLKYVALERLSYEDINLSNLNGLLDCNIQFSDYKPASKLISSVQSSDLRGLKILVLRNVGLECEAMDILSKLKCVKELNLTWSKASRPNVSQLNLVDLRHLEYLEELTLKELHASDVVSLQMLNLRRLKIGFATQQRAPRLIATLLSRRDGSLTTLPDGSHFPLEGLRLKNVCMLAGEYMRLLNQMIQSGRKVDFTLTECTIEGDVRELHEKVGDQAALQVEAPQSFLTRTMTYIRLKKMTVSADVFMRLVLVVSQSRRLWDFTLTECTIEGAVRELHEKVGDQAALQVEAPQSFLTRTFSKIRLEKMTVSADVFMRLVLVVSQSRRLWDFTLTECTIEGDVRELHEKVGDQAALQVEAPQSFLTMTKTNIRHISLEKMTSSGYFTLNKMTVSADVFMCLVLVVSQSGHIGGITLTECTIEGAVRELHEKVGDQTALQVEAPQSFFTLNNTNIRLEKVTVSADVFMRLVLVVSQSERRVLCQLQNCTIEPVEEVRKLQVKMEDQPAIYVEGFSMCGQVWCIQFINNR
ncbi:NLR family CARD domain-containing protein 4-like [Mya arenaria]|uniref:NLR family CARD domain-containing protein 4-like n=1 Tax=Mya arenaria TaxID=6604 RepID=UPI0022DF814B|nr:NLR family CARD domain-containing protein 4-like [Mya arenaria]